MKATPKCSVFENHLKSNQILHKLQQKWREQKNLLLLLLLPKLLTALLDHLPRLILLRQGQKSPLATLSDVKLLKKLLKITIIFSIRNGPKNIKIQLGEPFLSSLKGENTLKFQAKNVPFLSLFSHENTLKFQAKNVPFLSLFSNEITLKFQAKNVPFLSLFSHESTLKFQAKI